MSGWIKFEKDLVNDPRVLRIASRLRNAEVTPLSRDKLAALGALVVLWSFADTHIRQDDTIECTADEINEVVGIANFCDLLPSDWLQVIDSDSVHLPYFLAHNGVQGKKKALNQKRQQRHRVKSNASVTLKSRKSNAPSVTSALPDQDQDQDHKDTPLPSNLNAESWQRWLAYRKSIKKPLKAASLQAAAQELAKFGNEQAAVVQQSIANGWTGLFELKKVISGLNGKHLAPAPNNEAAWAEARSRAKAIGFRDPHPQESPGAYMTDIKMAETSPRTGPHSIAALAQKMRISA